jgi:hypothetical protein
MTPGWLQPLLAAVQTNCHIADSRHASELPLCIYLLQMREYHRWEHGLPFGAELPRATVGGWLAEREALWDTLEGRALVDLPGPDRPLDAWNVAAVNTALQPLGLSYGAGLTGPERPVFFVAECLHHGTEQVDGEAVQTLRCGRELARSLGSPLAMLDSAQGRPSIVLRQAALARWLWERFEAHGLRAAEGPFHHLAVAQGLHGNAEFNAALPRLQDELSEVLLLHEMGEWRAGRRLGGAWSALRMAQAGNRRAELRLRAVRDHLADLGTTLPTLLAQGHATPLQFWFAGFEGHREALFPGLKRAYAAWHQGDGGAALQQAAAAGLVHFRSLADDLLALHGQRAEEAGGDIAAAIAQRLDAPAAICLA